MTECPWITIKNIEFASAAASLYGHYKSGHLYEAGGIADQPCWYLDAMKEFDSVVSKAEKEKHEETMKKYQRK